MHVLRCVIPPMALFGLALGAACNPRAESGPARGAAPAAQADRWDCPDHEGVKAFRGDTAIYLPALTVAGVTTTIPEFHDCQRLIDSTGVLYGPRVGVFIAYYGGSIAYPWVSKKG